jgi:L-fuconolactonase
MAELAERPNVSCKLSGLLTEAGKSPHATLCTPWIEYILEVFGTERIIWGSDWPVLELASDYQSWFEECYLLTKKYSQSKSDNIFSNNATRIYKLSVT